MDLLGGKPPTCFGLATGTGVMDFGLKRIFGGLTLFIVRTSRYNNSRVSYFVSCSRPINI